MSQTAASATSSYYTESQVVAGDGTSLFLRRWLPGDVPVRAHVLILHGYFEHGGRYRDVAHAFGRHGIATATVDLRGHGRSDGQRGFVSNFAHYLDDVQVALDALTERPLFILGHSHGGLVALDFVVARKPPIKGLILTNPFLGMTVPAKGPKLWVGKLAGRHFPRLSLPSGLDANGISHDTTIVEAYRRDPLVFTAANAGWFREVAGAQARVNGLRELAVPLLYVYSDSDPIASPTLNKQLSEQLRVTDKTVTMRAGERHEVLNETARDGLHNDIAQWMLKRV